MSKKNENINEEVKNAEETAEDIKDTETKEEASKETEETKEAAADDKIAELEASVADWKDKYQRLMAEFENARKRTAKEATQRYALAAALGRVKDSGITVLTAGTIPPNPTELLSAPMTEKIFASLQKAFDYVIVDTPPVSLVTDAAVLCRMADGVLLVVRPGVTTIQSAQLSKKNLEAVNAHILGVVMNGYNGKQSGRRDGYSYAYSYSYYDEDKKGMMHE